MRGLSPRRIALCLPLLLYACSHGRGTEERLGRLEQEVRALRQELRENRQRVRDLERERATAAAMREAGAAPAPSFLPPLEVVRLEPEAPSAVEAEEEEDDGFIFIVDRGGDDGSSPAPTPAQGASVRPQGADKAPPLPTRVALRESLPDDDPRFDEGMEHLGAKAWDQATQKLEAFVRDNPRDGRADNALLATAEAYRAQRKPGRALRVLERLVTEYPAGDAVPAGLLLYGEICLEVGRRPAARAAFERLVGEFPGTSASAAAQKHLATF